MALCVHKFGKLTNLITYSDVFIFIRCGVYVDIFTLTMRVVMSSFKKQRQIIQFKSRWGPHMWNVRKKTGSWRKGGKYKIRQNQRRRKT